MTGNEAIDSALLVLGGVLGAMGAAYGRTPLGYLLMGLGSLLAGQKPGQQPPAPPAPPVG